MKTIVCRVAFILLVCTCVGLTWSLFSTRTRLALYQRLDFAMRFEQLDVGDSLMISDLVYDAIFAQIDRQLDASASHTSFRQIQLGGRSYPCLTLKRKGRSFTELIFEDIFRPKPSHYKLVLDEGYFEGSSLEEYPVRKLFVYRLD